MDATRVGCRTVAEWIQTAYLVSSNSVSQSDGSSSSEEEEWTFLYLLILPLHPSSHTQLPSSVSNASSLSASTKPPVDLKSIPPVALAIESSAPSGVCFCIFVLFTQRCRDRARIFFNEVLRNML